jgi:hypothetical protein
VTASWKKKEQEIDIIVDAIAKISEGRSEDELIYIITELAFFAAKNIPAKQRRQWAEKLTKKTNAEVKA